METEWRASQHIETGLYRIPLPVTLSDSTHGEITAFELITCRVRDADGAEGVGYTYTVGRNGGAIADILRREIPELIEGREADDTEAIWHHVWWGLHYGGRGGAGRAGAVGARHRAVGFEGAARQAAAVPPARRLRCPRALLCRRHRPRSLRRGAAEADRRQSRQGLSRHQDEGRPARSRIRRRARAGDARASRRRLSADGGCQHEMDGRGSDPRRPRAACLST